MNQQRLLSIVGGCVLFVLTTQVMAFEWQETERRIFVKPGASSCTAEYVFKNTSTEPLFLTSLKQVGYAHFLTVRSLDKKIRYEPGEKGRLEVFYQMIGAGHYSEKKADTVPVKIRYRLESNADDVEAPRLQLHAIMPVPIAFEGQAAVIWYAQDVPENKQKHIIIDPSVDEQLVRWDFSQAEHVGWNLTILAEDGKKYDPALHVVPHHVDCRLGENIIKKWEAGYRADVFLITNTGRRIKLRLRVY